MNSSSNLARCYDHISERLQLWGSFVKFSHSIFALPFALGMFVLCAKDYPVSFTQLLFILICLVAARTSAMAFNRIVDRKIDSANPRTSSRELPAGRIHIGEAWVLFLASSALFVIGSYLLGWHCLILSVPVLFVLCGYSLAKRFTDKAHLILGFALALAPGGVWYALTAQWSVTPLPLMGAVLFWVAGFDILYSCQDVEFDQDEGLFSIPARYGVKRAFFISKLFHVLSLVLLVLFGWLFGLSNVYFIFACLFGIFLFRQHRLISPKDLSRIDAAFFTQNGLASLSFFAATVLEYSI